MISLTMKRFYGEFLKSELKEQWNNFGPIVEVTHIQNSTGGFYRHIRSLDDIHISFEYYYIIDTNGRGHFKSRFRRFWAE